MILKGLLNPQILSLLARVRHTNLLVIADRGFPYWPQIETVDLSLVDDVPKVAQVVEALRVNHHFGEAWMAKEFAQNNSPAIQASFSQLLSGLEVKTEAHEVFKKKVPSAIGLIRTGDTTPYANIILVSA
jgi:D-ribose pyranase